MLPDRQLQMILSIGLANQIILSATALHTAGMQSQVTQHRCPGIDREQTMSDQFRHAVDNHSQFACFRSTFWGTVQGLTSVHNFVLLLP